MNLTYEDCLGFCNLTEDEIRAIAEHENITEMAALELGQYLVQTPEGELRIKRMILDDIAHAERERHAERLLTLKAVLKRFVETHPCHPTTPAAASGARS